VRVPIPPGVRSLGDLRPSRGEARWAPGADVLEWRVGSKDVGTSTSTNHGLGTGAEVAATLKCVVQGDGNVSGMEEGGGALAGRWEYEVEGETEKGPMGKDGRVGNVEDSIEALMPTSASVSFQVRGWLASGVKVEKLVIDQTRSRGLAQGVQPYKGVKYLTVSQDGVETRC